MMEQPAVTSILHPTDFSQSNNTAFVHALRLAVATRSALHLFHVDDRSGPADAEGFPNPSEALARWKMLEPGAAPAEIESKLGVRLINAKTEASDVAQAVGGYAEQHNCDLLVLMTHALSWLERMFIGSLAEASARLAHAPALFLREGDDGFVDKATGAIRLRRVLMPVAAEVGPMHAWGVASNLVRLLEPTAEFRVVHVGETLPTFGNLLPHVELLSGPVLETILEIADQSPPDLIVMATAGHRGLFDDVRGSTTERVLREAPCPVLAIPGKQYRV
ncbi:universal stress protein [Methylocystis heyeri]|uniref:Universal stress protein n=1 Tax=Methylocystis heyeri TaxID=391905 RepID=A0A6B8KJP0_9HYPH|nr:universal stress protein [Methylocystis heyeri]QGM46810.1 universal stress protein [Methylocystis heyeri]